MYNIDTHIDLEIFNNLLEILFVMPMTTKCNPFVTRNHYLYV